jgi:hypothetical protein
MAGQGMEELQQVHDDMQVLKKSRKELMVLFLGYIEQIKNPFRIKYGVLSREYGITDQSHGESSTGRLSTEFELIDNSMTINMDFRPSTGGGQIVYTRNIAEKTDKALMVVSGILPVIRDCARNLGLNSAVHPVHYDFSVKPISFSIGGDYAAETLPRIRKLIVTMDDLVDLYLP